MDDGFTPYVRKTKSKQEWNVSQSKYCPLFVKINSARKRAEQLLYPPLQIYCHVYPCCKKEGAFRTTHTYKTKAALLKEIFVRGSGLDTVVACRCIIYASAQPGSSWSVMFTFRSQRSDFFWFLIICPIV